MSTELMTSWNALRDARLAALSKAQTALAIFDRDLAALKPDAPETQARLIDFLSKGTQRQLRIAVHDLERTRAAYPKLMLLLKNFGHRFTLRETPDHLKHLADSLLLADDAHGVVQFHFEQPRSKAIDDDADELSTYLKRFEDLWAECGPPASSSTLGL